MMIASEYSLRAPLKKSFQAATNSSMRMEKLLSLAKTTEKKRFIKTL
jgi:hypothetical protein